MAGSHWTSKETSMLSNIYICARTYNRHVICMGIYEGLVIFIS